MRKIVIFDNITSATTLALTVVSQSYLNALWGANREGLMPERGNTGRYLLNAKDDVDPGRVAMFAAFSGSVGSNGIVSVVPAEQHDREDFLEPVTGG